MLYYVKTGVVSVRLEANSPKHAAIQTVSINDFSDLGICTIVSENKISEDNSNEHTFFLTENILSECTLMRLVS